VGTMQFQTLTDVFAGQIGDLESAEQQLISALPQMATSASNGELRDAFERHLEETRTHARRLEQVKQHLDVAVPEEECKGMKGLIAEGEEILKATGDPNAKDAALIAAAQRVEHYEIAAYGTARTLAKQLELNDAARLLDETLDEESNADSLLTKLATGGMFAAGINEQSQA
jgi:ferritin-like metal-binding protein YciE